MGQGVYSNVITKGTILETKTKINCLGLQVVALQLDPLDNSDAHEIFRGPQSGHIVCAKILVMFGP